MKRIIVSVLTMLSLLSACSADRGMEIQNAWARAAMQGGNGAIYFVIQNGANEADEMTGVSSDVAEAVEMHETRMEGDVMQMHPLESVPLPAKARTTFKPGGLHIMLIGMKKDLKVGDQVELTLHFKNAEDINLVVPVQEAAESENH